MRSCPLINNPIQDYGPHASTALTFLDYEPPNIPFASLRNPPRILFGPKHVGGERNHKQNADMSHDIYPLVFELQQL